MSTGRKKYGSLSEQNYAEMKAASDARKKKKKNAQFTKLQESDAAGVKRDEAAAKRKKDAANTKTTYNKKTAISPKTTPASRTLKKVKDSFSPKAQEDARAKALRLSAEARKRAKDAANKPGFFSRLRNYGKRQAEARKKKYDEAVAKKRSEGKTAGVGTIDMNKGGMIKKAAYKKGGVVKKTRSTTKRKSIDGIALRGKTRAARSR
tara:strand:- start:204 stop:824 length:621 start_codon:yes stop_codon:yes gene_type:complete